MTPPLTACKGGNPIVIQPVENTKYNSMVLKPVAILSKYVLFNVCHLRLQCFSVHFQLPKKVLESSERLVPWESTNLVLNWWTLFLKRKKQQ